VKKLARQLEMKGYPVGALQGNLSQNARERVLKAFRSGELPILFATNVAARGLDIEGIGQVINYELPESAELFTHRVGRTGRMGREGEAITLITPEDEPKLRQIERLLGRRLPRARFGDLRPEPASRPASAPRPAVAPRPVSAPQPAPRVSHGLGSALPRSSNVDRPVRTAQNVDDSEQLEAMPIPAVRSVVDRMVSPAAWAPNAMPVATPAPQAVRADSRPAPRTPATEGQEPSRPSGQRRRRGGRGRRTSGPIGSASQHA
jgi:superfamily II DNA/RNA helicase